MFGQWKKVKNCGFTLVEMIVVILIIGILTAASHYFFFYCCPREGERLHRKAGKAP